MAYENISVSRARRLVYNEANMHGPIISKENFPTISETTQRNNVMYSNKVKSNSRNQTMFKENEKNQSILTAKQGNKSISGNNNNNINKNKVNLRSNLENLESETANSLLELSQSLGFNPSIENNNNLVTTGIEDRQASKVNHQENYNKASYGETSKDQISTVNSRPNSVNISGGSINYDNTGLKVDAGVKNSLRQYNNQKKKSQF